MTILSERAIRDHYRICFNKDALALDPDEARDRTAYMGWRWIFRSKDVEDVRIWRKNRGISFEEFGEALEILQEGGQ